MARSANSRTSTAKGRGSVRSGRAEIALAIFVAGIVGLLIVPVPTPILDVLLATSLSLAVVVLLVVLYVSDALAIATFPTLLLLTTLYRLALNVSSSRLILLQGDAGAVIKAFGNFVVRGNYLVGGIIFAILTIIQFIVIAKGSERVAEVAARFALDAMPGKQMAIDAELRAGSIDASEARRRRRSLARESQFYGAMDGAMKFVKGDVVASLIITAINLLGGLAVGVLQRDMPAVEALKRYGLLTIGDGLVTQIPALVTSTAAGLLVTRVASEEPDTPLGGELAGQLFGNPKALFAASALVAVLGLIPGLPALPFLILAALLVFAARGARESERQARSEESGSVTGGPGGPSAPKKVGGKGRIQFLPMIVPWSVDLSADGVGRLDDDEKTEKPGLRSELYEIRERLFAEYGLPLPPPRIAINPELPVDTAVIAIREIPVAVVALDDIAASCFGSLIGRGHELIGIGETQALLDALEEVNPALVRQLVPKPLTVTVLTEVLRRLLEERVSIRDMATILQSIAPIAATEKDPLLLAETARAALKRAITLRLTHGARELSVYLLDPMLEDVVRSAITRTTAGSFLTLAPAAAREVVASVRDALQATPPATNKPLVFLSSPDVRRFFRKLLEAEFPQGFVTSYAELEPELRLEPRARITPR